MTNETLARSEADRRIRRTATVAAWLCTFVAAASLIMTVVSLWLAADLTRVGSVLTFVAYLGATRVCQRVADTGEVFSLDVVRALRRVSVFLVLAAFVPGLLHLVGRAISGAVASQLMVEAAFIPTGTVIVDTGALAIGAPLFAICRMFEYGCILQKQDDELL
ncbi:MAG: hypothetical protein Q4B91_00210 [Atopobiaceae bacterium]|nr:hypothetical protein [Atopobiaceae bacterium]